MKPTASGPVVRATALTKRFGGFTAVDGVDLTIGGTGITALIGPNGAGKTTFFDLVTGHLAPTSGSVEVAGHDVTGKRAHTLARRGIARTFQDVRLFGGMSVLENVALYAQPSRSASLTRTVVRPIRQRRDGREALRSARAILEYLGIEHVAGVQAGTLGFAQQKLVAIARVLALKPKVLFLDEPASGLDPDGINTLSEAIRQLGADGYDVCFIEHNTHLVRELAARVVFFGEGRVIADGPTETVFDDPRLAEVYLGIG